MKTISQTPTWVRNLRQLMDERGMNPRSLSLLAGLNATAVRDMLEGRSRFPRYDTVKLLATALGTTPAQLMSDRDTPTGSLPPKNGSPKSALHGEAADKAVGDNIELLTEIITRLQEVTEELDHRLAPRDFAAMTTTIYRRLQASAGKKSAEAMGSQIHDLLDYERLRQKRGRGTSTKTG